MEIKLLPCFIYTQCDVGESLYSRANLLFMYTVTALLCIYQYPSLFPLLFQQSLCFEKIVLVHNTYNLPWWGQKNQLYIPDF